MESRLYDHLILRLLLEHIDTKEMLRKSHLHKNQRHLHKIQSSTLSVFFFKCCQHVTSFHALRLKFKKQMVPFHIQINAPVYKYDSVFEFGTSFSNLFAARKKCGSIVWLPVSARPKRLKMCLCPLPCLKKQSKISG